MHHKLLRAAAVLATLAAPVAHAQSTEEKFQDLFVTAGYCTAFGAAVGTAFLAWTEDPTANLRYVAMGASLGFIGGAVLGTYVIFAPGFTDNTAPDAGTNLASLPDRGIMVRPVWNVDTRTVSSVEAGTTVLSF